MPELLRYILLASIVYITTFQEAVTGFGTTALALPFVTLLLGIDTAVKVLVIQACLLTCYIVISSRKDIVWKQYLRIAAFAGLGLPLGMLMAHVLPKSTLKLILGVFMIGVASRGLFVHMRKMETAGKWSPSGFVNWLMNAVLFLGGIIHGAFGSGGPLIIVYATKALQDKRLFRVTLCMLWFTLDSIMISRWGLAHELKGNIMLYTGVCIPVTALGTFTGDRCHHRINERAFRLMVFCVLLLSGVAVLYSVSRG